MVIDEIKLREALRLSEMRREELEHAAASIRTLHGALDAADIERAAGLQAGVRAAADLAHELRTPLYAIRHLTEDLGEAPPGALHEGLAAHRRGDRRIARGGRPSPGAGARQLRGRRRPRRTRSGSPSCSVALRGMLEPLARRAEVQPALRGAREPSRPCSTDGVKLAQILRNLMTNALRNTGRGRDRGQRRVRPEDTRALPRSRHGVRDRAGGPGAHLRARRAAHAASAGRGAGLGLTLARRMARMIGGDIGLESVVGEGSCFTVRVPIAVGHTAPSVR